MKDKSSILVGTVIFIKLYRGKIDTSNTKIHNGSFHGLIQALL